jgi:hypothetical protein
LKYEKSNLIYIQTNDNLVILTYKIDTLIALTIFLKKCEKCKRCLDIETDGVCCLKKNKDWLTLFFTNHDFTNTYMQKPLKKINNNLVKKKSNNQNVIVYY